MPLKCHLKITSDGENWEELLGRSVATGLDLMDRSSGSWVCPVGRMQLNNSEIRSGVCATLPLPEIHGLKKQIKMNPHYLCNHFLLVAHLLIS